jgi:peptidoglycan-N-acetylglucosamine deacetylase
MKYNLTGTFYVPRRAKTEVMNEAHIRELSRQFEIGAHTLDHIYLDTLPRTLALDQISGSKQWVEEVTGRPCKIFCFPGGRFDIDHLRAVCKSGFRGVRTVEMLNSDGPRKTAGLWEIPTTIQAVPHFRSTYIRNVTKRAVFPRLSTALAILRSHNWSLLAMRLLREITESSGVFHLWGHSWEIEEYELWGELEELFSAMSKANHQTRRVTNWQLCADNGG